MFCRKKSTYAWILQWYDSGARTELVKHLKDGVEALDSTCQPASEDYP
jgi:hypothetical protein